MTTESEDSYASNPYHPPQTQSPDDTWQLSEVLTWGLLVVMMPLTVVYCLLRWRKGMKPFGFGEQLAVEWLSALQWPIGWLMIWWFVFRLRG